MSILIDCSILFNDNLKVSQVELIVSAASFIVRKPSVFQVLNDYLFIMLG